MLRTSPILTLGAEFPVVAVWAFTRVQGTGSLYRHTCCTVATLVVVASLGSCEKQEMVEIESFIAQAEHNYELYVGKVYFEM